MCKLRWTKRGALCCTYCIPRFFFYVLNLFCRYQCRNWWQEVGGEVFPTKLPASTESGKGGGPQKKVKLVSRTGDLRMNERSMPKQSCFSFLQVERLHSVKLSPDVSPQPQATVRMFWGEKQITAKRFLSLNILRTVPTSDCVHWKQPSERNRTETSECWCLGRIGTGW